MPQDRQRLFTADELRPRAFSPLVPPPSAEEDRPDRLETWGAAFRLEGIVGSLLAAEDRERSITRSADYDALNDIAGYEGFAERFIYSTSPEETARVRRQIDRELADRDVVDRAGAEGVVASIAAGVLDPVNLLPVGGATYRSARTGEAIARGVGRAAFAGATSEALAQSILMASQETRTPEEAAFNIGGSTLLAGALGGGAALLGRRGTTPLPEITDEVDALLRGETVTDGSLSASATMRPGADLRPEGSAGLEDLTRMNPVTANPLMDGLASPSDVVRNVTAELADTPQFLRGNARGEASPISAETLARLWDGPLADSVRQMDDLYLRYRTGRAVPDPANRTRTDRIARTAERARVGAGDLVGQRPEGMLDYRQFREAVAEAMRRGDTHEIAEVAEAARFYRQRLFDPLKDEAIALRLLDEDVEVTTAPSYLTRMFDADQVTARRPEFVRRLTDWFAMDGSRTGDGISRLEAESLAEDVADAIATQNGSGLFMTANLRGPLKERTLNVPDALIEDFLVNDIERVARYYARQMGAQTALAEKFGSVKMDDQIRAIRDDYAARKRKAPEGREQQRLQNLMERDIRNVEAMRDRLLGTYGAPSNPSGMLVRTGRVLRNLNYTRMMGGATLSSIADVGNVGVAHGWHRLFGKGLPAFIANTRRVRMANRELELAGAAVETVLNGRALQFADALDDFGRYSRFERGLQWVGDQFGKANLLSAWTDAIKKVDGLIASTRMMQAIDALESGKRVAEGGSHTAARETRRLRQLGIDAEMQRRIAGQFRKHGDRDGGVWLSGVEDWTDREAARAWLAAIRKDVDQTIVTPGMERPLWMSQEWGKLVGQFKSFGLAATLRLTTRALQQRDLNALQGVITLMMLGGLTVWIKAKLAGREPPDDPVEWALASAEQSGIAGWVMDANNIAERVGVPGLYRLSGARPSQRYAARNVAETIGGPSVGLVQDAVQITGAATSPEDDFGRDDIHRARLMVPFQNLFYLRWLFDQAEDKTGDSMGEAER